MKNAQRLKSAMVWQIDAPKADKMKPASVSRSVRAIACIKIALRVYALKGRRIRTQTPFEGNERHFFAIACFLPIVKLGLGTRNDHSLTAGGIQSRN